MKLITPSRAFREFRIRTAKEAADRIFDDIKETVNDVLILGKPVAKYTKIDASSEAEPDAYVLHISVDNGTKFCYSIKDDWVPEIQQRLDKHVKESGWSSIHLPLSKMGPDLAASAFSQQADYMLYHFMSFRLNDLG